MKHHEVSTTTLVELRKRLKRVVNNPKSRCIKTGICSNVRYTLLVVSLASDWPLHSGQLCYPIPGGLKAYLSEPH